MSHPFPNDRIAAIEYAQKLIGRELLFLDTETTGLTDRDEICEIAVVDLAGNVLINSLVKPARKADWAAAAEIHGINREMVQDSPSFRDLLPELDQILRGRSVLVYNVEFDKGKLWRSADAAGLAPQKPGGWEPWWELQPDGDTLWSCAMELYAAFYGDWNEYHCSYRWVRLSTAVQQCGITLPNDIHRARADAEMTRQLVRYLAAQSKRIQLSFLTEEKPS